MLKPRNTNNIYIYIKRYLISVRVYRTIIHLSVYLSLKKKKKKKRKFRIDIFLGFISPLKVY